MAIKVDDLMKLAVALFDESEFADDAKKAGRKATDYSPLLNVITEKGFIILPAAAWKKTGANIQKFARNRFMPVSAQTGRSGQSVKITFRQLTDDEKKAKAEAEAKTAQPGTVHVESDLDGVDF